MAAAAAARGKNAMAASNYELAIKEYTLAIAESPTSPDFYLQRSTAQLRANNAEAALADADQAVMNGINRAKKESVTEGQLARGKALYKLGRLGDALFVLELVKKRDEKHKQVHMWINKAKLDISKLAEDDVKRQRTVSEVPEERTSTTQASVSITGGTSQAEPGAPSQPAAPQQTPADKIRYEWYQSTDRIYFTLLAKGVSKDKAKIDLTERSISVNFPLEAYGSEYGLHLEPLFAAIDVEKTERRIMSTKIEIILAKKDAGIKWSALESNEPVEEASKNDTPAADEAQAAVDAAMKEAVLKPKTTQVGPAYPTSSKSGPKNWDKIGEGEDDEIEGDEANHFFKKLYAGSSPDVQRAMMKSYQESNGTALSTNWDEVSKGRVETVPPDGMEAKPYAK